ncbi:MAG: ComF family protein [Tannerellaceae bacterium]|jgi:ComF family protein|nr:ComF family protein [Tannerellaceae bacterium]
MKMISTAKEVLNDLIHLFFPKLCLLCKEPLIRHEELLCLKCLYDLPRTNYAWEEENPVYQRFIGKAYITHASSWLHYQKGGKVQQLVHSFKYHDNKEAAYQSGKLMAMELGKTGFYKEIDLLIPVPLHKKRKRERGYNQSEQLCAGIASVWNIPVNTTALQKMTRSSTQTNKTIYARWINVRQIFTLTDKHLIEGKHILLVDDVVTSGSTLCSCAEVLTGIPQVKISILTLASAT